MQDLIIIDAYMNLAASIILQTYKDIELWERQAAIRKNKSYKYRNDTLLSKLEYQRALDFLKSEPCHYLKTMVIDWSNLMNDAKKELE